MHDQSPTRLRRNRIAALAVTAMLALAVGACGDDAEAAYCDAWESAAEAYAELRAVDVTAVGTEGLQTSVDDLDSALEELGAATEDQVGDEVRRFRDSVGQFIQSVLSPDLSANPRDEVTAAAADLRSAWDDVADTLRADCPGITPPTS